MGPLGSGSQACQGVGGGRGCWYFSSHSQGPLLGPWCPGRGPQCRTLWEPRQGLGAAGRQGLMARCCCRPALGPTPLAETSQVTFKGVTAALGGSPKARGLLLAFSCPLARLAWAWPEEGLASAWPHKVAEPANLCLGVQKCRTWTAAHTRVLTRPPMLSMGAKGQGGSVCLKALNPSCPIDSKECPATMLPPVAGLSPGRSQRSRGSDPAVWPLQPVGRHVTGRLRIGVFVPTVGTRWDRDTQCAWPGQRFAVRAPSVHFRLS